MKIAPKSIAESFRGKRVFVTGHTGFKGSWLCLMLHQLGAKIGGYALAPETPGLYGILNIDRLVETSHIGDIGDRKALTAAIQAFAPDVVFHLAAQPVVLTALRDPVETFQTNVMGTVHVLEALRNYGGKAAAVIVSSDKCYKNQNSKAPYSETDMLGGSDPYTASKACTEIVTAAYRESYFTGGDIVVASARAGNVLGGGDFAENRLIPDLYRAAGSSQPLVLRYPDAIRPWQYVLDVVWGYVTLAGHLMLGGGAFASEFNFANAAAPAMTVREVIAQILPLWGLDNHFVKTEKALYAETQILLINPAKALKMLGWSSKVDNMQMLKETAQWYKMKLKDDPSLNDYTMAHVRDYLAKVAA